MNRRERLCATTVLALGTTLFATAAAAQATESLSFVSEPGEPMGLGQRMTLSPLYEQGYESGVSVSGRGVDGDYHLSLEAPGGAPLQPGVYEHAHGGAVDYDPARPRLLFRHESERCDVVEGRFEVTEYRAEASGYVERLRATFEQRCAGSTATLWGQVDIVKPALEPLTEFTIAIDPVVEFIRRDSGGATSVYAHFTAFCNSATGGTFEAVLEQERGPAVTRAVASDRMGCTPGGSRERADLPTAGLRPGPATLTIDAFVIDPILGEEGPYTRRVVTQRVLVRPARER